MTFYALFLQVMGTIELVAAALLIIVGIGDFLTGQRTVDESIAICASCSLRFVSNANAANLERKSLCRALTGSIMLYAVFKKRHPAMLIPHIFVQVRIEDRIC